MDPIENPETKINEPTTDESDVNGGPSLTTWLVIGGLAVVGVALLAVFFSGSDSTPTAAAEGDGGIAGLVFTNEDGTDGTLADYEGEPLVVNFFASWCAPCRAEMPAFEQVHLANQGDVQFVGVNTRETDINAAREVVDVTGVTYTVVLGDDGGEGSLYQHVANLGVMPTTAFIDDTGTVVDVHEGILTEDDLASRLQTLFG